MPKLQPLQRVRSGAYAALVGILFLCVAQARAQSIDAALWITNGRVNAVARSGNTLYAGGTFSVVGPRTGGGMPADTATGAVLSAAPAVRGEGRCAVGDGAGGWYIGGVFDSVGTVARANLAHIRSDFTVDAWNPTTNGQVNTLALSGGRLVFGGTFTQVGGITRNRAAQVDAVTGSVMSWNPNPNGQVDGVAIVDTTVYLGGWFNFVGPTSRNFLAAIGLTGGVVLPWNPGANTNVNHLSVQNGRLYVGGIFVTVAGVTRNRAAAFDATTGALLGWAPLVTSTSSTVTAIRDAGDRVYLGGSFTSVGAQGRLRLVCVDADSGTVLPWNAQLNGQVLALELANGKLYAGGVFTSVRSTRRYFAACLDTTAAPLTGEGALLPWAPTPGSTVFVLAPSGPSFYVGGTYTSIGGIERLNAAAFDLTTGQATAFDPALGGAVNAVLVNGGSVYLAGAFLTAAGSPVYANLAKFDGVTGAGQAWNPGMSGIVNELVTDGTTLWLGGSFSLVGGQVRTRMAAVDLATAALLPFDAPATGNVNALALWGDTLYVGGLFNTLGGQTRNRIAAVDKVTGAVLAWNPNSTGSGVTMLLRDGANVLVGGTLGTIGGQVRGGLAELDAASGLATGWNPNASSSVDALELAGTTLYCAGSFTSIGGQPRVRLAAIDRASALATSWNPNIGVTSVTSLVTGLGKVCFGGSFGTVNGLARSNLAALHDPALPLTAVGDRPRRGGLVVLSALSPTPLHGRGSVRFTLEQPGRVSLDVLDVRGARVRTLLADVEFGAGSHAVEVSRRGLGAGVYFLRLRTAAGEASRRFVALP